MIYKTYLVSVYFANMKQKTSFDNFLTTVFDRKEIFEGLYILKYTYPKNSEDIKNEIFSYTGSDIQIFIMKTGIEASWNINIESDSWLKNNL